MTQLNKSDVVGAISDNKIISDEGKDLVAMKLGHLTGDKKQIALDFDLQAQHNGNKSAAIRHLASVGFTTSEISKVVCIIYQFARNVLKQPLMSEIKKERAAAAEAAAASIAEAAKAEAAVAIKTEQKTAEKAKSKQTK